MAKSFISITHKTVTVEAKLTPIMDKLVAKLLHRTKGDKSGLLPKK